MLDKKNIFRPSGVASLMGLVTVGLLYLNSSYETTLKTWLEEQASRAYGAKINIKELSLHPLQGHLELKKIGVTHPSLPLKNIFQLHSISISFNLHELLKKKIVISSAKIEGIDVLTQRAESGVLDGSMDAPENNPALWEKTDSGFYGALRNQIKKGPLKYLSQITTGAYTPSTISKSEMNLKSREFLSELNRSFEEAHKQWSQEATLLPTESQLSEWQTTVNQWNRNRDLASNEEIQERKDLALLLNNKHMSISHQLKTAQKRVADFRSKIEGLAPLLNEDIETLKKSLSLPTAEGEDLSFSLFGLHVIGLLEKISFWSSSYRNYGSVQWEIPGFQLVKCVSEGTNTYHFLQSHALPSFFIQNASLLPSETSDKNKNSFSLGIKDLTLFPHFYNKVATLNIKATIPEIDLLGLEMTVQLDALNNEPRETFDITLDSFPLENATVKNTSDFDIKITQAIGKLSIKGSILGSILDVKGSLETHGTHFLVKSQFQPFEEILESLTKNRTSLFITGTAKSSGNGVDLQLQSEFGKQMAKGIKETFSKQLAQIDDTLRGSLLDSLFSVRNSLNEKILEADSISLAQLRNKLTELELIISFTRKYSPPGNKVGQNSAPANKL